MLNYIISSFGKNKLNIFSLFICFFFIFFSLWIVKLFGAKTYYIEILYNFIVAHEGTKDSPFEYKVDFFLYVIILTIFFSSFFFILLFEIKKKITNSIRKNFFFRLFLNYKIFALYGFIFFLVQFKFYDYLLEYNEYKDIKGLYSDPRKISFTKPQLKKNLILIYIESLDTGINSLQKVSPIKEINEIKGQQINNFKEAPAVTWSSAGMMASMCGVPLHPSLGGEFFRLNRKKFYCIGDVLSKHNYVQSFYISVGKQFHRHDTFFERQGYKVHDKLSIHTERPDLKLEGWGSGIHDDDFFNHIKFKIIEKHKQKKLFNFTIKTSGTHPPFKISKKCKLKKIPNSKSINPEAIKAYRCLSIALNNFIKDLEKERVLDDTILVIMGDHKSNAEVVKYNSEKERNLYFKIYSGKKIIRSKMNHFDVAPSILDVMGFLPVNTSKFGFGYSLFTNRDYINYNEHYKQVMNPKILSDRYIKELFDIKFSGYFFRY